MAVYHRHLVLSLQTERSNWFRMAVQHLLKLSVNPVLSFYSTLAVLYNFLKITAWVFCLPELRPMLRAELKVLRGYCAYTIVNTVPQWTPR